MRKMIRLMCLFLALMCLSAAAFAEDLRGWNKADGYVYLTLGEFPQTEGGYVEPILWRVLSVDAQKAYILSEYVLEARRIHGDYNEYANKPTHKKLPGFEGDYTQTEMAQYLNGEFASTRFTEGEIDLILPDEALGLFYLVSADDLKNKDYGFVTNEDRKAWGTEYALANGLFKYQRNRGSHSPYWTRNQSTSNKQAARCIKSKGELGYINVITEDEGMRPACCLDMTKAIVASGSGTKEDPFILKTGEPILAAPVNTPVPAEEPTEIPVEELNEFPYADATAMPE